ncbi:MAG: DNA-3-methyladenine glycosylase 2 family protein [Planctomycetota bacterium]
MTPLSVSALRSHARKLVKLDGRFAVVLKNYGYPPLWNRPNRFSTLVLMVLEQQVSLASAKAAFDKLKKAVPRLTPAKFLKLSDQRLKSFGFSRQKTGYCRGIAQRIVERTLVLGRLPKLSDQAAREQLMAIKGIGEWTASVYLMMVLLRPDVWPDGDRALAVGAAELFQIPNVPSYAALGSMADHWAPFRSTAARMIWHHYLSLRSK